VRRLGTSEGYGRYFDFGGGVVGNVSDYGLRPRHLRLSDNLLGRPKRAMGSVRNGYAELQNTQLPGEPTSVNKFIPRAGGARKLLVHYKTGVGTGALLSVTPGTAGYASESMPGGFTTTDQDWMFAQLNYTMYGVQTNDSSLPVMYENYSSSYKFDNMLLKIPTINPGVSAGANGNVDAGYHWWRIRYVYRNGASKAGTPFPTGGLNVVSPNETITLGGTNALNSDAAFSGQDCIGWRIERTKLDAAAAGLYTGSLGSTAMPTAQANWWTVTSLGTANTYVDVAPDSSLFERVDDNNYGDPQHMEGIIAHKDRLWGWSGSNLYVSQSINDYAGSGPCNWNALNTYFVGTDDGDKINSVEIQFDRLIFMKSRRVIAVEGSTPQVDIRLVELAVGPGSVGARASCCIANTVYMLGETGFHTVVGNQVDPGREQWGKVEVGHYLDDMNASARPKAVLTNIAGEFLSCAYPSSLSTTNDQEIIYDFQMREFRHYTNRRIRDSYIQADNETDFGGSTMLWIDPVSYGVPNAGFDNNPALVLWGDDRTSTGTYRPFVQQVSGQGGAALWAANGVTAATVGNASATWAWDACTDGGSGWYVAFADRRSTTYDVYVARYDSTGNTPSGWNVNGLLLRAGTANPIAGLVVVPDGSGGVVVVWKDTTTNRLRAQRVTNAAAIVWAATGVDLPTPSSHIASSQISGFPDGSGGAFVSCPDGSASTGPLVQHLRNTDGASLWGSGTMVAYSGAANGPMQLCSDGSGGVYMTTSVVGANTIRLWRVSSDGTYPGSWNSSGISLATTSATTGGGFVWPSSVVSDGSGGAIVAWNDIRSSALSVAIQRVNSAGSAQWTAGGVIASATYPTSTWTFQVGASVPLVSMVQDGLGGVVLCYAFYQGSSPFQNVLAAQRINSSGAAVWSGDVTLLSGAWTGSPVRGFRASTDGASGAIFSWVVNGSGGLPDVYIARVSSLGFLLWGPTNICPLTNSQSDPHTIFTATPAGQFPPSLSPAFRLWRTTGQYLDAVLADGTGGQQIVIRAQSPFLDDGVPDLVKDIQRFNLFTDGAFTNVSTTITVDLGDGRGLRTSSVNFPNTGYSTILGDESATIGLHDLVMANEDGSPPSAGSDVTASDASDAPFSGVAPGTKGKRYQIDVSATAGDTGTMYGFVVDGLIDPERSYS
jgi:hypothetical protein